MASIVENILGNKALQPGGEEFVRKMQIGNNWNLLRIAGRVAINGTSSITSPRMLFGLCNGDTDTFASSNCAGYMGVCPTPITNVGNMLNWDGVNLRFSYSGTFINSAGYVRKLGATVSEAQGGNQAASYMSSASGSNNAGLFVCDFERLTSVNYRATWHVVSAAAWALTPRFYDMLRVAEDTTLSYGPYITAAGGNTALYTGLPTNFDTVSVYWNKTTPTIDLLELMTIRFY